jgi:heme exporter protein D
MNWDSWSDFLAMGGYARYVWGSFAVVFGALAAEQLMLHLRREEAHTAARLAELHERSKR